jgi:hypothetical protein
MSKARGLADLGNVYDDGALSNRSLIINGDFQVSQRGNYTSAFAPTNNTYYLDRWINSLNAVTGTLQDIGRKVKLVATSTGSGTFRLLQKIELQTMNKFNNQTVTLSAKVKSNSAQARLGFYADGYIVPTGNTAHTGDGTEQTLTAQITVPASTLTIEFDVFIGLQGANAGNSVSITSGDYVEITEVQLEVGDTATPFEHRSYGDELARCQRYYQFADTNNGTYTFGPATAGFTHAPSSIPTSVQLRTSPTVTLSGNWTFRQGGTDVGISGVYSTFPASGMLLIDYALSSSAGNGIAGNIMVYGVGAGITMDAEL